MGSFGLYFGWDWFLWLGLFIVILSSFGNWGYTYSAHRKFNNTISPKSAVNILNERYASGEVLYDEYMKIKSNIYKKV